MDESSNTQKNYQVITWFGCELQVEVVKRRSAGNNQTEKGKAMIFLSFVRGISIYLMKTLCWLISI